MGFSSKKENPKNNINIRRKKMKKTRLSIISVLMSCCMVFGASALNIRAKAETAVSNAFTGGIAQTGNLFEVASISDNNYLYNQCETAGTVGDYIKVGGYQKIGGISQYAVPTSNVEEAVSYAGAKLTLTESTTLDMGVVDLTNSKATDINPVIGFLPTVNYSGPKVYDQVTNPILGVYYTFRSTVNPDKYFDIAMIEAISSKWKYSSIGVAFNGSNLHYGQTVNPENPDVPAGKVYAIEEGSRVGSYAYRFDGSIITSSNSAASTQHGRVWDEKKYPDGSYSDHYSDYNYPAQIYYDYETSKFYLATMEYQLRKKMNNDRDTYIVTADDDSERYLLLDASKSIGSYGDSKYNDTYGWEGFTEEEAASVAVTMHVDWNPAYEGTHDIVITEFAGQKVNTATADTLKANKGTSGLLKEFTGEDGTLTLSDGYSVNLSDNDVFTKLVSFEVYPDQIGKSKAVSNSGLHEVVFTLSDGTNTLNVNLKDFEEPDANGNPVNYRNCVTVSVNGEAKWAQQQKGTFAKSEYGYPLPYHFDKYIRYVNEWWALDQFSAYEADGDVAEEWTNKGIRTDVNTTTQTAISIYYNAKDNCLYADAGYRDVGLCSVFERNDGRLVKRWKIADLGSTYDGQREAFAGFGDKELTFSMATTLVNGFDSVKIRVLEVDGQKLATDKDGNALIDKVYAPENGLISSGMDVELPKPYTKEFFKTSKVELNSSEFTTEVTAPDGTIYTDITDNKFDFDQLGEYLVNYYVDGKLIGATTLTPAVSINGELVAITSFGLKGEIAKGDVLTLNDIALNCGGQLASLEGATITLSKDGTIVSTDANVDANWTSDALEKGTYEISVVGTNFAVNGTFTAKTRIKAEQTVENGMVKVNGVEHSAILLEGDNTIQVIASEGYELATFTIGGEDVTSQLVNGYYTYSATEATDNVYYTATFTKLTYTVTFMVDGEVVDTITGVEYGTLLGDVELPAIPEREGYIGKWSVTADTEVKSDVTVNAVYELETYTITFDTQGGSAMADREYSADEPVTAFGEEPTKEGYDFDGWYNGETKFVFGELLTGDITLTAKWTAKKFTVTIIGGELGTSTMEVEYGTSIDETTFAKEGYTFNGLFVDEECTIEYEGEAITGDTTLYASWTKEESGSSEPSTSEPSTSVGCMGSASVSSALFGLFALAAVVAIKRKR